MSHRDPLERWVPTRRNVAHRSVQRIMVLLVMGLLLASCGGLPTSGPVEAGQPIRAQSGERSINILAASPQEGDDEIEIVEGFLAATGSYAPGYTIARRYLTDDASSRWDPSQQVQVYDQDIGYSVSQVAPGEVSVSLPLVARVDTDGTYRRATPGTTVELIVGLQEVAGEWRISLPPPGLIVSEFDFNREFGSFDVYFPEPSGEVLVPDQVVLPLRGSLTTLLVQGLLDGPSSWLAPAVRTAFPEGTTLAIPSVSLEGDLARVELSEEAKSAAPLERSRMAAQLATTLEQVGIGAVAIEVDGTPLAVPGAPEGVVQTAAVAGYDPATPARGSTVYAIRDGIVVAVVGDKTEPVAGRFGTGEVRARSVSVSLDGSRIAVVDETGRRLMVSGFEADDPLTDVAMGTDLSAPSWGPAGLVWVADRAAQGSRLLVSDGATTDVVQGVDLTGLRIESLKMAPDGVRLLMLANSEGRSKVMVGLVRKPDVGKGTSGVQLLSMREIPLDFTVVTDAVWSDSQLVSVLGGMPDAPVTPYQVDINGFSVTSHGSVPGATTLAAAPGMPLVVGTGDGKLVKLDSLRAWTTLGEGQFPTYPG
jgi:Lipoprotein LpqB beta-propeller domain/Sporulation and spore germination